MGHRHLQFRIGGLAAAVSLLVGAAPALAQEPQLSGWLVDEVPMSSLHTPLPANQYLSSGQRGYVLRSGVGEHTVVFPGLAAVPDPTVPGSAGVAHVTARGERPARCTVGGMEPVGADERVTVHCVDIATRQPVDSQFTVTFTRPQSAPDTDLGFVRVTDPSGATPGPEDALNVVRGAVGPAPQTTHVRTGLYDVVFPGATSAGRIDTGGIKVTALNKGAIGCTVTVDNRPPDLFVRVPCFDAQGSPADSGFAVSVNSRSPLAQAPGASYAYIFASLPLTLSRAFNRTANDSWVGPAFDTTDVYGAAGRTLVLIPGAARDRRAGAVHATVYEPGSVYVHCQPAKWFTQGTDVIVDVICVDRNGAPASFKPVAVWYDNRR